MGSNSGSSPSAPSDHAVSTPPTSSSSSIGLAGRDGGMMDHPTVPRTKRIACLLCRKRKLRCDGSRPSCASCLKHGHGCVYDEVRKKTGPKKGYVRTLEARLAKLEKDNMYRSYMSKTAVPDLPGENGPDEPGDGPGMDVDVDSDSHFGAGLADVGASPPQTQQPSQPPSQQQPSQAPQQPSQAQTPAHHAQLHTWPEIPRGNDQILPQGIEEPLPPKQLTDKLHDEYFEKMHITMPMIHRPRYLASFSNPNMRPNIALRYIVWALGADVSCTYKDMSEVFYLRARKYLERDDVASTISTFLSLAHCQAWVLVTLYEFRHMFYTRAWLSIGRCCRLATLLGLLRVDAKPVPMHCSLPDGDWCEMEERRRTFWACFSTDRQGSSSACWPTIINEEDIFTNLPSMDESFEKNQPGPSVTLRKALAGSGFDDLGPFAASCVTLAVMSRTVPHVFRYNITGVDHELDRKTASEFWKRHQDLDLLLSKMCVQLPSRLRLPAGSDDPSIVFTNMCLQTATIMIHQYALTVAKDTAYPSRRFVQEESQERCHSAAIRIVRIMRMLSHMDLATMPPFIAYSLFTAARSIVTYLSENQGDTHSSSSLEFLVSALRALTAEFPLAVNFLIHLEIVMEQHNVVFLLPLLPAKTTESAKMMISAKRCSAAAHAAKAGQTEAQQFKVTDSLSSLRMKDSDPCSRQLGAGPEGGHQPQPGTASYYGEPGGETPARQSTTQSLVNEHGGHHLSCTSFAGDVGLYSDGQNAEITPSLGGSSTISSSGATPDASMYTPDGLGNTLQVEGIDIGMLSASAGGEIVTSAATIESVIGPGRMAPGGVTSQPGLGWAPNVTVGQLAGGPKPDMTGGFDLDFSTDIRKSYLSSGLGGGIVADMMADLGPDLPGPIDSIRASSKLFDQLFSFSTGGQMDGLAASMAGPSAGGGMVGPSLDEPVGRSVRMGRPAEMTDPTAAIDCLRGQTQQCTATTGMNVQVDGEPMCPVSMAATLGGLYSGDGWS